MTPSDEETDLCEQATTALAEGNLHKAAEICKSLLVSFPTSARGYALTSSLFQATGNYRKACDYSAIATQLDDCVMQYHLQQGHMLYILKHYEQAEGAFRRAVSLSDEDMEACRWLGNSLAAQERFDEAREWFAKARVQDAPAAIIDQATCEMQSGDHDKAEKILSDVIAQKPHNAQAHFVLALLAIYASEFERAETHLRKALAIDMRHTQAHFYLSLILAESGEEKLAMERLLQTLSLEPTHIPSLLLLGSIFMKSGVYDSSEKAFNHVLALAPDHLLGWYSLLELLHEQDRGKEGLARLSETLPRIANPGPLKHMRALFAGDVPPAAPKEFVAAFYDAFADMFEPWVVAASEAPHIEALLKELRALPELKGKKHLSLLDIGCNTGLLAQKLAITCAIFVGIDVSPAMLRIARRSKRYDVLYDLDLIDYVGGSETVFDLVISTGALRWVGNLQPFFHAVRGVMHQGSILAFTLDKERSTLAYSVANHGRYSHHLSYVQDMAESAGFELLSHKEWSPKEGDDMLPRHLFFFKKMTVH